MNDTRSIGQLRSAREHRPHEPAPAFSSASARNRLGASRDKGVSMAQSETSGRYNNKNLYYIIGGLAFVVIIGAVAYQSGYFGDSSATTTPNVNGSPSTTNTTTP
jgi:hypothetical protein